MAQRHERYKTAHKRAVRLDRHSMDNNRGRNGYMGYY